MLLIILFLIEIILLITIYYTMKRDIFRPSFLMVAVFAFSTFIAILNIENWNINYLFKTLGIMTLGLLCAVAADYLAFNLKKRVTGTVQELQVLEITKWKILFVIAFDLISLFLFYKEIKRLAILDGYVSGTNLLWHYRNITSYQSEEALNGFVSILLKVIDAFGYVFTFAFIENLLCKKGKFKKYFLYLVPVGLFAVKVLMGSGRQELLRWAAFIVVSSYVLLQFKSGWKKSISSKYIIRVAIAVPIALTLFYLSTNIIGRSTSRTFFQYISTYAGGSIQHFNQYITDSSSVTESHFGAETFPGIYSFLHRLGLTDYTRPVHLEMRKLGVTQGNVYTFFRRPLHDFGLLGMCIMTFVVIFVFSYNYSSLKKKKLGSHTNYDIICYCYLFYWVVLASIENYSIGIVSIGTIMTLIIMKFAYIFLIDFHIKGRKCIIKI